MQIAGLDLSIGAIIIILLVLSIGAGAVSFFAAFMVQKFHRKKEEKKGKK
ncbi:Uncharacterised protein [uncultured Roseburia sp.]|uniref:Uncharacterized protein n=1 Tax=Brotonthovivens ammoniilytica TaxID=2981725 RepID=A0ABT2TMU1_9FIRM|nr:hypothetical protein [Brotonthovivens ammoniilytica]MCU6763528.1 hypothetical protein [Brotonthovivens ammoniilytica]SCJ24041.1 Uncharacterised protein [uncultured Roseburia sp.]